MGKDRKFYEVVVATSKLLFSPSIQEDSINTIQDVPIGVVIERMEKKFYLVNSENSVFYFIKARVGKNPDLTGYMAILERHSSSGNPADIDDTSTPSGVIKYFLLRTPLARLIEHSLD